MYIPKKVDNYFQAVMIAGGAGATHDNILPSDILMANARTDTYRSNSAAFTEINKNIGTSGFYSWSDGYNGGAGFAENTLLLGCERGWF